MEQKTVYDAFHFDVLWNEATKAIGHTMDMIKNVTVTAAQKAIGLRDLDVKLKLGIATSTKNSNMVMLIVIAVIFVAIVVAASMKKR